jgi:predicted transcriptional regulator
MDDEPLSLETRRRLYTAAASAPGRSAREIQRAAGTAWGETTYHLERLEKAGLLHRERGPHQDFYFVATVPLGERTLLRVARSIAVRRILIALLDRADQTLGEVAAASEMSLTRASIHVRRLLETGLVHAGRRDRYRTFRLSDRDRTARILVTYRAGFGDALVDGLTDTWGEMFPP